MKKIWKELNGQPTEKTDRIILYTFISVCIALLFLSSCITQKRCNKKFPPREFSSTEIKTTYRPLTLTLRVPPVMVAGEGNQITIINDTVIEVDPSFLETDYAFSRAWITNNKLMHTLNQKTIKRDTVVQVKEVEKVVTNEIVKEVRNPVNWWLVGVIILLTLAIFVSFSLKH
jgi:hypothetical protein